MKKNIICIIITFLIGAIWYYFVLPPINIQSFDFWIWLFLMLGTFSITSLLSEVNTKGQIKTIKKKTTIPFILILVIAVSIVIINLILSPVFMSKKYATRININEDGVFTEDVKQVDFNALPLLDRDSSMKLGDRVMGQMPEMVSDRKSVV